jgi:flagellar motor switch protein FliG
MNIFNFLNNVDANYLFTLLKEEQLQTIAIVLVNIDRDLAADVLGRFPEDTRAKIAIKMAQTDTLPEMVIKNIAESLKSRLAPNGVKLGGIKAVADMLKHLKD